MDHEGTIREAYALLRSGNLAEAIACLAVAVNSLPPLTVASPCDDKDDGDWVCRDCSCWKAFRAVCS